MLDNSMIFWGPNVTTNKSKCKGLRYFSSMGGNVLALGFVSLFNDISSEMIYPLLPLFLTETLGAGAAMLGVIEGIAESTASVLKLFSGWLSDRLRKRKILAVVGYTISTITRPLIAIATAGWHILVIRFSDRVGKGVRTSPRDALLADSSDEAIRGKAFGFHRAMDHAGAVIGPLLATAILAWITISYRTVFYLAVIPAIIGVLILILRVVEKPPVGTPASAPKITIVNFDRPFRYYLGVVILFTLGNSTDAFLILRARNLGVPIALIPTVWLVLHIVKMLTSTPGGSLSDKLGRKRVIALGWLVYALVYAGFALASEAWHAWALFVTYGLYFGLCEGTEKAFVADLVKPELRGTAYGMFHFAVGIGALPASVIMGLLWNAFGPAVAFGFGASLALLSTILLSLLREKHMRWDVTNYRVKK